jgi:hypothetical protein
MLIHSPAGERSKDCGEIPERSLSTKMREVRELLLAATLGVLLSELCRKLFRRVSHYAALSLMPAAVEVSSGEPKAVAGRMPPSLSVEQSSCRSTSGPAASPSVQLERSSASLSYPNAAAAKRAQEHSLPKGSASVGKGLGRMQSWKGAVGKAGDSDSDEEKQSSVLPRELLSPVPADQATTIIVFGVDGDLASKKLMPTLFHLWRRQLMPHDTLIMGYARPRGAGGRFLDTAEFRAHVRSLLTGRTKEGEHLPNMDSESEDIDDFCRTLHFSAGQVGVDGRCPGR